MFMFFILMILLNIFPFTNKQWYLNPYNQKDIFNNFYDFIGTFFISLLSYLSLLLF